ncbi:hypothetical protein D7231_07450 [Streptomyces klenkii]|uniref:Uncharacterized protein n=1 Tax=Streptomyces klenkii TaxID=1420899 RepID=A0A3B0BUL6_9ACTN|nr:hypothetical protein D7231_07450 [Streptomyces klenkii]
MRPGERRDARARCPEEALGAAKSSPAAAPQPRQTEVVPDMTAFIPGVRLRALTVPGCPRMLQVALRACAPQTEQVALALVVCPLGCTRRVRRSLDRRIARLQGCPASAVRYGLSA